MRFENQGLSLWYGTADTPTPTEVVQQADEITITLGVQPADASNEVEVSYRVNHGPTQRISAKWLRHDLSSNAQYFSARFVGLRIDDTVEYAVVCRCAGRQVPSPGEASRLISSFRVVNTQASASRAMSMAVGAGASVPVRVLSGPTADLRPMPPPVTFPLAPSLTLPTINIGRLPVIEVLTSNTAEKQIVINQLNAALKSELTSSAMESKNGALGNLLQTLTPADLSVEQNLSLRDFVGKHTTLPTDPAANHAAQAAITTLSSTTTVGALLGLNRTIEGNPIFSGMVAQTNLTTLLTTSPALTSVQLQTDFINKYAAFQGTMPDFWTQLSQDAEFKEVVPELQLTMQLGALTLKNALLVSALRTTYKPSSLRDLTKLDAQALQQLITSQKIPIPSGISGSTPAEQLTNYVNGIVRLLEAAFPTDYVAKGLAASTGAALQSVAKVLSNSPGIDLGATNLDGYLKQNAAKAFQGIPQEQVADVTKSLKRVQRVFRINPDSTTLTALLSAGLDSASKIAALSQSNFVKEFSSKLGGDSQAQAVYSTASHINAQAVNVYRTIQGGLKEVSPRAIANPAFNLAQAIEKHIPNWEELFGPTSYCDCGECSSVYGAAAYFVDLLQFLGNSKKNAQDFTPLDVLLGRRPDLPYINLDCQNTNTPLPYIDLVNEILESYIHLSGKLDSSTAQNVSPDATAAELSVNAGNTIDDAYAKLKDAIYPLSLPYDRHLNVARRYLAFLGGSRLQVLELFQTQQAPGDNAAALAAEVLGLSRTDFALIANWDFLSGSVATPPPLRLLYVGNAPATEPWKNWISIVPNFLRQTGLAFSDLIDLLETRFVNSGRSLTLVGSDTCDLTKTTIISLDDAALTRILPVLRLWRKLGWAMSDLDKALRVFAPAGINRGCLLALADLKQLQVQLNLPLPQLLSLWSDLDTDGPGSLYLGLFQNKAVLNPVDPALALSGADITPGATITDETPAILAALRISADDLNLIRTATGLVDTATKVPLNLATLSQLYRHAIFARALGLQLSDLISLIALTGIRPFELSPVDPMTGPAIRFVQAARAVLASPFSVAQLNYIYRAIADPAGGVGPLQANADQLVMTLQTGLQKIAAASAYSPDPTGKLLRQKLGAVLGSAQLTAVMGLLGGSTVYTASLAAPLPAAAQGLVSRVSYDSTNQLLESNGALSDADKANLLALSNDTAYQSAVASLYQQPRDILGSAVTFVNASEALHSSNTSDRYSSVLRSLLNYLTDTQSRSLVQQSLSQALSLDSATTALLLSGSGPASPALLKSDRNATQPAMTDFLDVRDGGLLATYFSDTALTTISRTQIDPTIYVAPQEQVVSNPGGVRWRGKVLPEFSESYTFYVTANDGVRLWVNDQLVIDQWSNQAVSPRASSPINLIAGQLYDIRLDYYNASATATVALGWSSKSTGNNANVPIPESALFPANSFLTLNRLYPIGLLLGQFGMKADEVAYLATHPADFQGVDPGNPAITVNFDLTTLPVSRSDATSVDQKAAAFFDQWLRLNDLFALRKSLPSGNVGLFDVFRAASDSTDPTQLSSFTANTVLRATGWDKGEFAVLSGKTSVNAAVAGFGLSDADFVNAAGRKGIGLVRLKKCLNLSQRLGVSALQLFSWANVAPSSSQANDINNAVKAKYDDATWLTVGKPLNNQIRDDSKAALIAYVLNMPAINMPAIASLGLTDADKLHEYFLIDVQMSSCMQTSRIVQATAAIQLFVQRCLLNLESGKDPANDPTSVAANAIDAAQWEWRKNYRVWQANRKVFLYPENWIDPTLRDDRTPFFKDLQTELQQGEVTPDRAETAFRNYLTKLLEVSRLEISGFFWENDTDAFSNATHNVFHVFGRTFASPHVYYYRRRDNTTMTWSPWERVDADIQGDHLIPVIWNRRLYLFWPMFKERSTPTVSSTPSLPAKSLEIRLAWSEYRNGSWTKKQATVDPLVPHGRDAYTDDFDPHRLSFDAKLSGPNLIPHSTHIDAMHVDEGLGPLTLTTLVQTRTEVLSGGQVEILYSPTPVPVLGSSPSPFVLSYPEPFWPNVQMNAAPPFLYADDTRTYLVTQQLFGIATALASPANAVVSYGPEELNLDVHLAIRPILPILAADTAIARATASTGLVAPGNGLMATSGPSDWQNLSLRPRTQFTFSTHRHAHVCDFLKALNWLGLPGLMTLDNQKLDLQDVGTASTFYMLYAPGGIVNSSYPSEEIDFTPSGAYSLYNWEIFFHIPLLMATQLSRNQQFADAEKWFRYIFNPASNSTDSIPSCYWNFLPFQQNTEPERIEDLLTALEYTGTDPVLLAGKASFSQQIAAWVDTPFSPDLIARMRTVAYQKTVVMKYIDHHLAWGDSLYQRFTRESVNEATLHYVLCQDLLGDKPVIVPKQGIVADQTYHSLTTGPGLDPFSDFLVAMENLFPFSTDGASTNAGDSGSSTLSGTAMVPYFCIPPNDILLGYWDTVAKRLFQIRHCMNIAGQVQELPLFAPPINPALLIRALAMGMDLTSALSDISASTPFYRFAYMLPKALELCAEVRSLGASLLSTLEKSDAEALSNLRATQETALMKAVRNVKQQQLNEANSNLDALNDSLAMAQNRQNYYQSLITAGLSSFERTQVSLLNDAQMYEAISHEAQLFGSELSAVPDATVGFPCNSTTFGGSQLAAIANFVAGGFGMIAAMDSSSANLAGLTGGWARRNQEWQFQLQTANLEITQINDQIKAANARVAAAQAELDNQDLQISNAQDVEQFLRTKYTNQALYDWMVGEISSIYFQCYQMAYDLAKRAEACFVFERTPDLTTYTPLIQFGYWDSLKKGLLSGERLYLDLKRLEIAYMEQNQRDYEITKSISLLLLDPMALINLKETGECTVQFPEALFDMDYPGHYLRCIESLGITIPCVVGPYTSINCTLTMASNKIRFDNTAADKTDYVKDSHYVTNFAAAESIVTSSGQNDSGLFVLNFNDERYLPFEGAGVISTWQLSMPQDTNAFDFETITDVIFNLKYTARDGGESLRSVARAAAILPPGSTPGATPDATVLSPLQQQTTLARAFSLRHEFPSEWYNFLHPPDSVPDQTMTINLAQERFPFRYRGKKIQIYQVDVFLKFRDIYDPATYAANGTPLGDYGSSKLPLTITSPSGAPRTLQLAGNNAILAGVPFGAVPQPPPVVPPVPPALGGLGTWTIVAKGADIGSIAASLQTQVTTGANTFNRLLVDAIEDVFLVCRYFTN